jgi:hypothetical protein
MCYYLVLCKIGQYVFIAIELNQNEWNIKCNEKNKWTMRDAVFNVNKFT